MGDTGAPLGSLLADGADIVAQTRSRPKLHGRGPSGNVALEPDGAGVASAGRRGSGDDNGGEQNIKKAGAAGRVAKLTRMAAAEPRLAKKRQAAAAPEAAAEPRLSKRPQVAAPQLPDGPRNLSEVLGVLRPAVAKVVEVAREAGMMLNDRLAGTDWEEVVVTTSYSGMGCAEAAISMVRHHLLEIGIVAKVTMFSATDINAICRAVLLRHKAESASEHVFGDVLDRIPSDLRQKLENAAARLRSSVTRRTGAERLAKGADAAAAYRKAAVLRLGRRYIQDVRKLLEQTAFPAGQLASCQRHGCMCRVCPVKDTRGHPHPLHVEIAGTTCTAWSSMGAGWGWLDKSALPCMVWMFWVLAVEPDIVLHECTPRFQHQQLADILDGKFWCESVVMSPEDWGVPAKRPRRYTMLLNRKWQLPAATSSTAPPAQASSIPRALQPGPMTGGAAAFQFTSGCFRDLFFKQRMADCDVYMVASPLQIQEYNEHRAARSSSSCPVDQLEFPGDVIPACARAHLRAYDELRSGSDEVCDLVCVLQSPYHIAPGTRQVAPSLLKGSLLFSLSRRRLMLPAETMLLQGFPVPSLLPSDGELASLYPFQTPLEDMLPDRTVRNLSGNGMHLCQVGCAFLIAVGLAVELRRASSDRQHVDGGGAPHIEGALAKSPTSPMSLTAEVVELLA